MPEQEFTRLQNANFTRALCSSSVQVLVSGKRYNTNTTKKFVSLTYFGKPSDNIANVQRNLDYQVAFKSPSKLSLVLFNVKDSTNKYKQSSIYRLKCSECNSIYIGQTGRNFETRYSEHLRSFKFKKTDSTFSNYLIENKHKFPDINNMDVLYCRN